MRRFFIFLLTCMATNHAIGGDARYYCQPQDKPCAGDEMIVITGAGGYSNNYTYCEELKQMLPNTAYFVRGGDCTPRADTCKDCVYFCSGHHGTYGCDHGAPFISQDKIWRANTNTKLAADRWEEKTKGDLSWLLTDCEVNNISNYTPVFTIDDWQILQIKNGNNCGTKNTVKYCAGDSTPNTFCKININTYNEKINESILAKITCPGGGTLGTKESNVSCTKHISKELTDTLKNAETCDWECVQTSDTNGQWTPTIVTCKKDYDLQDNKCVLATKAGDKCPADQLPQYATAGKYINSGGKLTCAATECKSGTYLVVNSSGASQGWCVASSYCRKQSNTHLNIIDGTKTDLQCIQNESPSTGTGTAQSPSPTGTENENPQGQGSIGDPAPSEQNPAPDKQEDTPAQNDDNQSSDDTPQVNAPTKPAELADGDKCTPTDANATAGIVRDGMCVPALCRDGFEVSDNRCVEIGGDCDTLPKNATAAHRKYDATKKEIVCIIDSCAKTYKVSDDKLSCVPDPQAQLDQARNAEQSLTARLTSGAAIGAMGIGGMQALSAVAEQNADEAAEQDMAAYLATFRCDFGQGRNIKGGEKQIELPGANSLFQLNQEYKTLAADLKVRKEALGLAPGLESESIIDAATSGLYDDVSLGRADGAFTSLARALSDEASDDAAEWAAQKADAKNKLKTGAIVAGIGAAVGIAGNIAVTATSKKSDTATKYQEFKNQKQNKKAQSNTDAPTEIATHTPESPANAQPVSVTTPTQSREPVPQTATTQQATTNPTNIADKLKSQNVPQWAKTIQSHFDNQDLYSDNWDALTEKQSTVANAFFDKCAAGGGYVTKEMYNTTKTPGMFCWHQDFRYTDQDVKLDAQIDDLTKKYEDSHNGSFPTEYYFDENISTLYDQMSAYNKTDTFCDELANSAKIIITQGRWDLKEGTTKRTWCYCRTRLSLAQ